MLGYRWACIGISLDSFLPNPIFKFIIHEHPLFIREDSKADDRMSQNKASNSITATHHTQFPAI